jgi:hypothetical protein
MVIIDAYRDCYSPKEAEQDSITVGELIEKLNEFNPNEKVILSHDRGYTYGYISTGRIIKREEE